MDAHSREHLRDIARALERLADVAEQREQRELERIDTERRVAEVLPRMAETVRAGLRGAKNEKR
jgi:hypothetical protein